MAGDKSTSETNKAIDSANSFSRYKELAAILSLAAAAFFAFLLWAPPALGGVLGRFVRGVGHGMFGTIAYLIPLLFLYLAAELYLGKEEKTSNARRICMFLFFLTISVLIAAFSLDTVKVYQNTLVDGNSSVWKSVQLFWESGTEPARISNSNLWNGGVLGSFLFMGLEHVVGKTGSMILLIGMLFALSVLVFDLSWSKALYKTADVVVQTGLKVEEARKNFLEKQRIMKEERNHTNNLNEPVKKPRMSEEIYQPELPLSFPKGDWSVESDGENSGTGWEPLHKATFELTDQDSSDLPPAGPISFPFDNGETESEETASPGIRSVFLPVKQKYLLNDRKAEKPVKRSLEEFDEAVPSEDRPDLAEIAEKITESDEVIVSETDREKWQDRSDSSDKAPKKIIKSSSEQRLPYAPPPIHLLNQEKNTQRSESDKEEIRMLGAKLEKTLNDFGVDAEVVNFITGPTISRFELKPGPGVKVSKIVNLSDDIALALAATGLRIEAPIPGKSAIGIEIPNKNTKAVLLRGLIESDVFKNHKSSLAAVLGRDIQGGEMICDIASMPHLLIAGATGSGKSVCINSILISLLYRSSPDDLKLLMIDPKVVELSVYNKIPHLLQPVVTDPKKAYGVLDWAVQEMNRRYTLFADAAVRDFKSYNEIVEKNQIEGEHLPLILLVIDELSDLMATTPSEVENAISRLTAMARAAGIHLIIATQRPSVDVITGVIKANIPSRIAFSVASQVDSRTILDMGGAEKLLGKGDMLYYPQSASKPLRGQGAFVTDSEVERVVDYLRKNYAHEYNEEVGRAIELAATPDDQKGGSRDGAPEEDELLMDALRTVVETGYASVSLLQRRLMVGYPRAARMIDSLHEKNWIGPHEGSKPRKVLITAAEFDPIFEQYEKEKLNKTT